LYCSMSSYENNNKNNHLILNVHLLKC
jgi:hypothetical protein